jgi:hypothetical protein
MKKVVRVTFMPELPENCAECTEGNCNFPNKVKENGRVVLDSKYLRERHEKCPLVKIDATSHVE